MRRESIMKKMFARIDWLKGKQRSTDAKGSGKRPLKNQRLRLESLEDRLLLSVTATDYQNICANYEEFALPSSRSDLNIIEIDADDLSIGALKDAISTAASTADDDLIVLRTSIGGHILSYSSADDAISIDIDSSQYGALTIVAYGAYPLTIDAAGFTTVVKVENGEVNLGNLTLRGGSITGESAGATYCGGGLYNAGGNLVLKNMTITANAASGSTAMSTGAQGGGIWNGQNGSISLYDSAVTQNTVTAYSGRLGGGIYNAGKMAVSRSEISGNSSTESGGGIYNAENATLSLSDSSVTANSAAYTSSAMSVYGGGLYNAGSASVSNTVFSENSASSGRAFGAGVYNSGTLSAVSSEFFNNNAATQASLNANSGGGALNNTGIANLYNCTISGNSSVNSYSVGGSLTEAQRFLGSGIFNAQTLNVYNSIIALNAKGGNVARSSTATSRGYFVISPGADWSTVEGEYAYDGSLPLFAAAPSFNANGVLVNADEVDLILTADSQAVDIGNNGYVKGTVDLGGYPRISGGAVDLGAYEYTDSYVRKLATPENFSVTAESPTELVLTWKSVPNADYYVLSYSTDQIDWTRVELSTVSYEMTVSNADTTWYFTIQAYSEKPKFAPSDVSDVISIYPKTLDVPENLEATALSASSIYLEWDAVENADSYTLRYWTITESNYTDISVSDTSYTLTKANGALTYHFRVCAVDTGLSFNDSEFSDEVSLVPGKLAAPENVTAEVVDGENSILLSWDAVEHADSYQITWRSSKSQVKYYVQTTDTSYTFTNLNQNYKYYFTVKAIGASPYTDSDPSSPEVSAGWSGLTVVNTLNDEFNLSNSTVSLREALYYAGSTVGGVKLPSTVTFDPDLAGGTCVLSSSLGTLEVAKSVTIDASGLAGGFAVDGGGAVRVFTLSGSTSEIELKNITVQNGLAATVSSGGVLARGGGIYSTALSLTLTDCVVTGNSARATITSLSAGNALAYGGGIYAAGALILSGTTVSNNAALATTYTTSAAYRADAYGGGIYAADFTMTHSVVTGNTAQAFSGQTYAVAKGGGIYGSGSVVNSLVVRNTAQADSLRQTSSSQIYAMAFGGGICQDTDLVITNSTVAKNSAWSTRSKDRAFYAHGGGLCAVSKDGLITVNNSIILLNNTSYIGAVDAGSSFPKGGYEGYDICLYTGNHDVITGNNNVSTFNEWSEASSANNLVVYTYETETAAAEITVTYDGETSAFFGEDAFQHFLDAFFVKVYDTVESEESLNTEDYRLTGTAYWAANMGNVSLACEADGSAIATDLDGHDRVYDGAVDIGAYELGAGIIHDKLTVTTASDVVDDQDDAVSLREAIAYAESLGSGTVTFLPALAGSEILLDADLGTITVTSGIKIDATDLLNGDGDPSLVINGTNLDGRIMTVESGAGDVTLTGLIFAYGDTDQNGGAIYSEADSLTIVSCQFLYNSAGIDGGAVYAAGSLSVAGSSFENNAAAAQGGAVLAGGTLTVSDTDFRANSAGGKGGAIYTSAGSAIRKSTLTSNTAAETGGALYAAGETSISDTVFSKNHAASGGAIGAEGTTTVSGGSLTGNTASENGGAVAASGTLVLSYSRLSANSADADGGALYQSGATLKLINSQIDNNAANRGGALFLTDGAAADFRNATVTANSAGEAGGVYASSGTEADLYNTITALNGAGADAAAEPGAALNAYAVLSGYTDWTNASEGYWTEYDSHYPLFNTALTNGFYTLSLTASQAIDQGINDDALDENGDPLSADILGKPRFVQTKTSSGGAIVDLGAYECQATDGRNIQQVYGKEDALTVLAGDEIALAIEHQVIKLFNDNEATTLSLRIHFNSDDLLFDPSNPGTCNKTDLTGQGNWTVYSDTEDYDGDETTDSYLLMTWNNQNKLWGGDETTELFSALNFTVSSNLDPTQDYTTYVRFSAANLTANFQFLSTPIEISVDRVSFDIDGDGAVNISTDVNLLLRYMAGKTGTSLTDNLTYSASTRDAGAIKAYLDAYRDIFDIDGDGAFNASIDGELLVRYLAGFTGDTLLDGISFTSASARTNAAEIVSYIGSYLTGVAETVPAGTASQVITASIDTPVVAGSSVSLNLAHTITPTDDPLTATTLSLRLYYDSSYFTIDTSRISYYTTGLVGPALSPFIAGSDAANEDGDPATDSWIQITWNRESGWTWNSTQIASLLNASIRVADVSAGSDTEALVSTIHVTSLDRTADWTMDNVDIPITIIPSHFTGSESDELWLFDIDGSGAVDIATDGNLLMRYLIFGNVMSADGLLVDGVSTRGGEEILEYLNNYQKAFDIDGDGIVKLDTDVTYFMKFFAGYRGNDLLIPNPAKKATRKTGEALSAYIKKFIPPSQRTDPVSAAALPKALSAEPAILLTSALPEITVAAPAAAPAAVLPAPTVPAASFAFSFAPSQKDVPAPEAAARLWEQSGNAGTEKPADDWFLPEFDTPLLPGDFFTPDPAEPFRFDTDWPEFF